ncbi:cytochrome bd biosynthesis ABC-type transporter, ATPase and permease component [Agrilactobacillus composti DSM 18527 = JCM 14202]|uniref:Cytochrome bd biosynthesis ABC-type transporter, ATPase and permease component n=1 Tax=Agrilactobacillus composti DSM 18527 = JCM 14202 TaxID=1423734 RepID=X0QLU5_9LACO|nr:thiol reductant ABC exporter subunit CydC [Agrilactobacillus composti]KRM31039.1 cytochrome bd biosynthesis ABC-type transporter, ATPase and permease component [Agrilactobacillus composti DSM 18527 = JCM 14202]GAF39585.1 transport ATP-binding protein CydC [Agrilactobacillus composti DSM 18527 = JCM 14202]
MKKIRELMQHDTWVKPYLKRYRSLLFYSLLFGVLTAICASALMFTSGYIIDRSATHPYNILMIYAAVVLTRAFGIGRPVFKYLERLRSHNWVLRVTSDLRRRLYHVLEKDAAFFEEHHRTGDILGILADDLGHLQNLYLRTVFPTIVGYIIGFIVIVLIGALNWFYGLLLLLLFFVEIFLVPLISQSIEGARRYRQKAINNGLYVDLTDNIMGASDWVISGRHQDFTQRPKPALKALRTSELKSKRFGWRRDFILQIIFLVMVLVLIIFTNQHLTANQAQANFVSAFVLAIFPLSDAFIPISTGFDELPLYADSVQRLNDLQPTPQQLPAQQDLDPKTFAQLTLADLQFEYDADSPVLINHFSQTLKKGEKMAVLGPSGTGKTTLLQLILGDLTPQQGAVKINDLNVLSLQKQRAKFFAVLNQSPFLFDTTIMNNVRLGNEQASDADVKAVLEKVQMKQKIESLPDQYDTVVQEAGSRFSGGERQRIALARILLQDTPVVLLDEPTVGLDPITEQELLETFFSLLKGKTVIWITHHLQGVELVDQVVFLAEGAIEMQGNPHTLLQTNTHFKQLYDMDRGY